MKTMQALTLGFLVGLGSLQIAADALGMSKVKGFAAALQVSPAMKVFTAHNGYETYAARFELRWRDREGKMQILPLDPRSYANVAGPYNRRNVYGAAFAYGPLMRADPKLRPMQESVINYALCKPGVLREELGISPDAARLVAYVYPVRETLDQNLVLNWEAKCHE